MWLTEKQQAIFLELIANQTNPSFADMDGIKTCACNASTCSSQTGAGTQHSFPNY